MKISLLARSLLFLMACGKPAETSEYSVTFNFPQPEDESTFSRFPKKLTGVYLNLEDSSGLVINKYTMLKTSTGSYSGLFNQMDSAAQAELKGDTIIVDVDEGVGIRFERRSDSIFCFIHVRDTLADLRKNYVLKKFNGYFFLSQHLDSNNWSVTKIDRTREGLIVSEISTDEEVNTLRELTNSVSDTIYNFRPTKKQLRKFLLDSAFRSEVRYLRVSRTAPNDR